jgi:hypothetical protein
MKKTLLYLILIMAITMAITIAFVSVSGLVKLFAGAGTIGYLLFGSIEAAKVVATSAIHTYKEKIGFLYKSILTGFIIIAMAITSLGIYGFLSSSYKKTFSELEKINAEVSLLETKKESYESQLKIIDKEKEKTQEQLNQLSNGLSDNTYQTVDSTGQVITKRSWSQMKTVEKQMDKTQERQEKLNAKSDTLLSKIFKIEGEITTVKNNSDVGVELGPLKYIADITGIEMDKLINYFMIFLVIIGDPMAVIMVVVFSKVASDNKLFGNKNIEVKEKPKRKKKRKLIRFLNMSKNIRFLRRLLFKDVQNDLKKLEDDKIEMKIKADKIEKTKAIIEEKKQEIDLKEKKYKELKELELDIKNKKENADHLYKKEEEVVKKLKELKEAKEEIEEYKKELTKLNKEIEDWENLHWKFKRNRKPPSIIDNDE